MYTRTGTVLRTKTPISRNGGLFITHAHRVLTFEVGWANTFASQLALGPSHLKSESYALKPHEEKAPETYEKVPKPLKAFNWRAFWFF